MLFTGEFEHTIDAKLRLAIPADIRNRLDDNLHGTGFYVAPGMANTLWLWPQLTFEHMAMATEASLLPDEDLQGFDEFLYSQAAFVEMDKTGRIRIPERLLQLANLGTQVTLLGVKDHLELRDPDRWAQQRQDKLASQNEIMMRARRAMVRSRLASTEDS